MEKARDEIGSTRNPGPPISWIFDAVRGTYVVDTMEELSLLLDALLAAEKRYDEGKKQDGEMHGKTSLGFGSSSPRGALSSSSPSSSLRGGKLRKGALPRIQIVRMKNRCAKPLFQGYRDFLLNIAFELPGGSHHVAELQVHFRSVKLAGIASKSHETYEYFRSFFAGNLSHVATNLQLIECIGKENHKTCDSLVDSVIKNSSIPPGTVSLKIESAKRAILLSFKRKINRESFLTPGNSCLIATTSLLCSLSDYQSSCVIYLNSNLN